MTPKEKSAEVVRILSQILANANSATGAADTTVTAAVNRLIAGQGGGSDWNLVATLTSAVNENINNFVFNESGITPSHDTGMFLVLQVDEHGEPIDYIDSEYCTFMFAAYHTMDLYGVHLGIVGMNIAGGSQGNLGGGNNDLVEDVGWNAIFLQAFVSSRTPGAKTDPNNATYKVYELGVAT